MPDVFERTARVILAIGDHVLLARHVEASHYSLIGGHIEAHETPEAALWREVQEETRRQMTAVTPVMVYQNVWQRDAETVHEELHLFHAQLVPMIGENQPQSNEAALLFEWLPAAELPLHDVRPRGLVPVLQQYASV